VLGGQALVVVEGNAITLKAQSSSAQALRELKQRIDERPLRDMDIAI
jgi:hypothetical protein